VSEISTTNLEKESLEAHVDLCALRYANLDSRLNNVEEKIDNIHKDITEGQKSMTKVLIGTAGTIIAGLLSTVIVIIMNIN
jgi:tetrahydromethanopterin S-methyltransferase subunit G